MPLITKIRGLCQYNNTSITKLEITLGYGNGSLTKNQGKSVKPERIREIAKYFNVTPTYLMTDMVYCVCPTCGVAYDPLNKITIESHNTLHKNFLELRDRVGYLLNLSEAATKRAIAETYLEKGDIPDDGKTFHYETLLRCDFSEYAYEKDFIVDISYADFMKEEIKERKHFNLIPESVAKNLMVKYNVDPNEDSKKPLIELFQTDKEFMEYMTDIWDLPSELRRDVYKAVRHAKRDYADKSYRTDPYVKPVTPCSDYDSDDEKCQKCERGDNKK